jgi:hypothetical protein
MPRVHHVKSARKDNPIAKKGQSYYWWKFRFGGKRYSLTPPRRSQLTQSPWLGQLYDVQDIAASPPDFDSLDEWRGNLVDQLEELASMAEESRENMPEQLQDSENGELLQRRTDSAREASETIQYLELQTREEIEADLDGDEDEDDVEQAIEMAADDFVSNVQSALEMVEEY